MKSGSGQNQQAAGTAGWSWCFRDLPSPKVLVVILLSLVLRVLITPHLNFKSDERAIYEIGRSFYLTGEIPAEGPKIVYTGESIPGGFQGFMAGLPLFFSKGEPIGLQIWVGILNWIAMIVLYAWLTKKKEPGHEIVLAFLVLCAPWSLLFEQAWNPSFLPPFSVLFFILLKKTLDRRDDLGRGAAFCMGLCFQLCLQLNLSAVLLGLCLGVCFLLVRQRVRFLAWVVSGWAAGGIFLIPWILKRFGNQASAPMGVIGLYPENSARTILAILRYFTFPTSEIFPFLSPAGQGFPGMLMRMSGYPLLWIPALIAFSGSIYLAGLSMRRWARLGLAYLRGGSLPGGFEIIEFWIPLSLPVLFLFSIKSPSDHTIWVLMPLSFHTCFMALKEKVLRPTLPVCAYLASSLLLAVAAPFLSDP